MIKHSFHSRGSRRGARRRLARRSAWLWVVIAAVLVATVAPPVSAQEEAPDSVDETVQVDNTDPESDVPAADEPFAAFSLALQAAIPGFYAVDAFQGAPTQAVFGLELDPATGRLWAAYFSEGIEVFDHDQSSVLRLDVQGAGPGEFAGAGGIAIAGGQVFIAERNNDRVQVLDTSGSHVRFIGVGVVDDACGVEVVGNYVYIAGDFANTVYKFTLNGAYVSEFDGSDSGTPFGLECTYDHVTSDGTSLYIVDAGNNRVVTTDLDGNYIDEFAVPTSGAAIDYADGRLWVAKWQEDEVEVFTTSGTSVGLLDASGSALGQINESQAVVVDPSGSTFWVGEGFSNRRTQVFTELLCVGQLLTQVGTSYNDTFDGTPGPDVVHLQGGGDTYHAGDGDDRVCGGTGSDDLYGDGDNDRLYGEGNGDRLFGGDGNDILRGGTRYDRLYGEAGNDFIYGDQWADLAYGGPGNDTIFGGDGADRLFGQQGVDTIYGDANNDKVYGGTGSDFLYGGTQDDKIWGETGNDTIFGDAGNDLFLDGGDHNDKVYGNSGDDIVRGGDGRDRVYGQGGNDDVRAQAGDDWVTDGGPGTDSCQVAPEDTPGGDVPAINCNP